MYPDVDIKQFTSLLLLIALYVFLYDIYFLLLVLFFFQVNGKLASKIVLSLC